MNLTEHLRANPELVSLDRATLYLASRVRTRTPLGASEFLESCKQRDSGLAAARCKLALESMKIYRALFPGEWVNSTAPYLSTQREQELYRLVDRHLFPLMFAPDISVDDFIEQDPQFYSKFIPMRGVQRHLWVEGKFNFNEIGSAFQLALAMSRQMAAFTWERVMVDKLPGVPTPAAPLAAVGWSLFNYSCQVEETPLVYFPLAFHFPTYKTGNAWLDVPQVGMFGFDWSSKKVAELTVAWMRAEQMGQAMTDLSDWFEEDPTARIGRAVELWNDAAAKEREAGGEGILRDEMTGEFYRREDWF